VFWPRSVSPKLSGEDSAEAMVKFFLARESGDRSGLPLHRDDLLNWIYLQHSLTCDQCGRIEEFDGVRREVAIEEDWVWPFAQHAVVQARQAGWSIKYDAEGEPVVRCAACPFPILPAAPPEDSI